jgi:hypothetical protein
MRKPWLAGSLLLLLGACGTDADHKDLTTPDGGAAVAPPPAVQGGYALESTFDVSASSFTGAFDQLKDLRKDPGATLFEALDAAGVPLAGQLHDALPGALQGRLNGWINDYVGSAKFQGHTVNDELDLIIALGTTTLARFELLTDLDLGAPDGAGRATATHGLRAVRFAGLPGQMKLTIPKLPPPISAGITEAALDAHVSGTAAQARLTLSDHAFGLPLGQYAYAGLNLALQQRYGADLKGTLDLLFDCPGLAKAVAEKCLVSVCVGHKDELLQICERGLEAIADRVHDRLGEYDFKALHFVSGKADVKGTGVAADRLDSGVWMANIDIGRGEHAVPATFTGARR